MIDFSLTASIFNLKYQYRFDRLVKSIIMIANSAASAPVPLIYYVHHAVILKDHKLLPTSMRPCMLMFSKLSNGYLIGSSEA